MTTTGDRVKGAREAQGLSQSQLAKLSGVTGSQIGRIERNEVLKGISLTLANVAYGLGIPVDDLAVNVPELVLSKMRKHQAALIKGEQPLASRSDKTAGIPEYDVRAGAGGAGVVMGEYHDGENPGYLETPAVVGRWTFPDGFMRQELKATTEYTKISEVLGDSMVPTLESGDRVIVDLRHTMPSPDGIYEIDDGYGISVKRLEILRDREGLVVNVISDNPMHSNWTMEIGDGHSGRIVGRVIGRISRM